MISWKDVPLKDRACEFKKASDGMSVEDKLSLMKGMYAGENVYVLSCGPSLAGLDGGMLREKLGGFPVMTVKQAYGHVEGIVDVHHFNCNNFSRYDMSSTISIGGSSSNYRSIRTNLWKDMPVDMFFGIDSRGGVADKLLEDCDFDSNTYEARPSRRMWGPGTLFETTLFSAYHTGASKISLIGVDLAPQGFGQNGSSYEHFYDTPESNAVIEGNKGILFSGENDMVRDGFSKFNTWLASNNVELEVCSDKSHLGAEIPRNLWLYS